jgi:hypothetical protein
MTTLFLAAESSANCELLGIQAAMVGCQQRGTRYATMFPEHLADRPNAAGGSVIAEGA